VEKEDILEGKIDSLMRRLEKMEIENKEAQDLRAAEARSTCEECGEYDHVHKDCPEEAKVLDYMRKGICRTFSMGKVDLKLMQAHLFRIRFHFVYN
jgi:DNA replication protein DnaC